MTIENYSYHDGLSSKRIHTRFLQISDAHWLQHFFENPLATEFLIDFGIENTFERAKYWIETQQIRYANNRYGLQVIVETKSNKPIGQCGLLLQTVDDLLELEIGYHFLHEYWGLGFATEAANLFKEYGFKTTEVDSIISIINAKNFRSQKVAQRNGMTLDKSTQWRESEALIYRILRSDFDVSPSPF